MTQEEGHERHRAPVTDGTSVECTFQVGVAQAGGPVAPFAGADDLAEAADEAKYGAPGRRYFHTTTATAVRAILAAGFRDSIGVHGFTNDPPVGVFLGDVPADVDDGAKGNLMLEVRIQEDADMDAYVIVEDGRVPWEWVVPASVLNTRATVPSHRATPDRGRGQPGPVGWLGLALTDRRPHDRRPHDRRGGGAPEPEHDQQRGAQPSATLRSRCHLSELPTLRTNGSIDRWCFTD